MGAFTPTDPVLQCIANQELSIDPSETNILEHPIVELSELGAFLAAPAPFAQQRDNVARGVVQHEKRIALPGPASGFMPMDQHHIRSPNVGLGLQAVQEYLKSSEFMAYTQCNGRTGDRIPHTPAC
jgi:hypothetical protein